MLRAIILAAVAALAVSAAPASASSEIAVESLTLGVTAAPVASAGSSKKPPPRGVDVASSEVFELNTAKAASKPRGTVVTKATDVSSTNRQRGAAGTSKKPPSAKFLDQPQPVTSFKPKADPSKAPRPAGNGIIAILIGAKAAPPPRSVTDGTSNTVSFGE